MYLLIYRINYIKATRFRFFLVFDIRLYPIILSPDTITLKIGYLQHSVFSFP